MAEINQSELSIYVPDNVIQSEKIFGFSKRNIIEGVLEAGALCYGIYQVPFVSKVKWILIVVLGVTVLVSNVIGIHSLSYTQVVTSMFSIRPLIKQIHYRRFNAMYCRKEIYDANTKKITTINTTGATGAVKNLKRAFSE